MITKISAENHGVKHLRNGGKYLSLPCTDPTPFRLKETLFLFSIDDDPHAIFFIGFFQALFETGEGVRYLFTL